MTRAFALPGGFYTPAASVSDALGLTPSDPPELRLPLAAIGRWPSTYTEVGLALAAAPSANPADFGFAILPYVVGATQLGVDLGNNWRMMLASLRTQGRSCANPTAAEWPNFPNRSCKSRCSRQVGEISAGSNTRR